MLFEKKYEQVQTIFSVTKTEINIVLLLIIGLSTGLVYKTALGSDLSAKQIESINITLDSLAEAGKVQDLGKDDFASFYKAKNKSKLSSIDIRNASIVELMSLPKIGQKTAELIINYRKQNQFTSTNDLLKVKGIGKKTLANIEKYLIQFEDKSNPEKSNHKLDTSIVNTSIINTSIIKENINDNISNNLKEIDNKQEHTSVNKTTLININIANKKELLKLDGVASSIAERIIEFRKNNKFKRKEDLLKVKGIGQKKFNKLKNQIKI